MMNWKKRFPSMLPNIKVPNSLLEILAVECLILKVIIGAKRIS